MNDSHLLLLPEIVTIAEEAGRLLMEYYGGQLAVEKKADASPVTDADVAANTLIVEALQKLTPEIPVIAEENAENAMVENRESAAFWLVDPLDGTKSFIRRTGQFTVNIGLIEAQRPVMGVIYIPVAGMMYYGHVGEGAWRRKDGQEAEPIRARLPRGDVRDVVVSHSHLTPETKAFLEDITVGEQVAAASSLKFCTIAEGNADIYPRFGQTMEWDTAAGHAIVVAAGGSVEMPWGAPLLYAKHDYRNGYFIAYGQKSSEE